jgi:hypothetical protein
MNPFTVYESWLDEKNIDVMAFLAALESAGYSTEAAGFDADGRAYWVITNYEDEDGSGVPDFLDALFGTGLVTNPSQGGMGG